MTIGLDIYPLLAILAPIAPPGMQFILDGDPESFAAVNPGTSSYDPDPAPTYDPSTAFSTGLYGAGATYAGVIRVSVARSASLGEDESVLSYESPNLVEDYVGNRLFTLTLTCEVDQGGLSKNVLERFRARLQRKSIRAALRALNLAVTEIGECTDLSVVWDNRTIDASKLDIELCHRSVDRDDTPVAGGGYIELINDPNSAGEPGPGPAYIISGAHDGVDIEGATGKLE